MAKFFFFETAVLELIVNNGNASGGAAVQTLMWMDGLNKLGHEVFLASFEDENREIRPCFNYIKIVPIYHTKRGLKIIRWISYRLPNIYNKLKLIEPDYFYESVPFWGSYLFGLICKSLGTKQIIRISNDNLLDDRLKNTASSSHQFFLFLGLKWSDIIFAQNNYQYKILIGKFKNKKIYILKNPIIIQEEFLFPKNNIQGHLAWIANFRYQKNLRLLYKIAKSMPYESIKIAGVPTSHFDDESKEYCAKLKLLENVEFLGKLNRDEIFILLQSAKFLLNTSRYEGFSNTFLEAMVTGTPILTSSMVNPDKIVSKNQLGFVYENVNELVFFLENLSEEKYLQLSKNCQKFVQIEHNHINLTEKLLNYLS
jgi:glycosyltransferase involved in cell wall biosynthesis